MLFETIAGFFGIGGAGLQVAGWVDIATQAVGVFSILAAGTKNVWDDKIAQGLSDLLNFLGANVGKAKNAVLILAIAGFAMLGTGCATQFGQTLAKACGLLRLEVTAGPAVVGVTACDIPGLSPGESGDPDSVFQEGVNDGAQLGFLLRGDPVEREYRVDDVAWLRGEVYGVRKVPWRQL